MHPAPRLPPCPTSPEPGLLRQQPGPVLGAWLGSQTHRWVEAQVPLSKAGLRPKCICPHKYIVLLLRPVKAGQCLPFTHVFRQLGEAKVRGGCRREGCTHLFGGDGTGGENKTSRPGRLLAGPQYGKEAHVFTVFIPWPGPGSRQRRPVGQTQPATCFHKVLLEHRCAPLLMYFLWQFSG